MAPIEQPGPVTSAAVVLTRHGGPEMLAVRPWQVPPPGPNEVRIRVEAAGISFADLLVCQGRHPEWHQAPFVPGWDVVGSIEAVGASIENVRVGQRVAALTIVGGWAEHAVVPAAWAVPVPESVESAAAVCLVLDYVTAYQMLTRSTSVKSGDTILIQGAGGGVGTALMQLARHLGVRALGTDREGKRAHVEAQGGILIDFEHEDVVGRCRELTGGRGVDFAFDGIGATARTSRRALRPGGRLVAFGYGHAGSGGRDFRSRAKTVGNIALTFAQNLRPGGKQTAIYSIQWLARRHPDWFRDDLATLLTLLVEGKIAPHIAAARSLDEAPAALASLAGHAPPGKQVIAIPPADPSGESAHRHPAAVVAAIG